MGAALLSLDDTRICDVILNKEWIRREKRLERRHDFAQTAGEARGSEGIRKSGKAGGTCAARECGRTQKVLYPKNFVKPMQVRKPMEAVYPKDFAASVGAQEPVGTRYSENFAAPAEEGKPVKRKGGKAVILLIVVLVLSAGILAAVFLLPHLDRDGWPVFGTSKSDSSARSRDTASSLPPDSDFPDSMEEMDPSASQASFVPDPEVTPVSDAQPASLIPAPGAPEKPAPAPGQAAPESDPTEPASAAPAEPTSSELAP